MIFKNQLGLALTGLTFGFVLSGCDTVARISFQEREFGAVRTGGFNPTGNSCTAMTAGEGELQFVLLADDNTAIRPGEPVARQTFEATRDAFGFSDTILYETPNLACGADDECLLPSFECLPDDAADGSRCGRSSVDLTLDGVPQFVSDVTNNQLFAVVVEGSGSLGGFLPSLVASTNPSAPAVSRDRASDSQSRRTTALARLASNFGNVQAKAATEGRQTLFGLWEFSGSSTAGVISTTDQLTPADGAVFTDNAGIIERSLALSEVEGTRANVYQAMSNVLDAMEDAQYANFEKVMVVFVDGPDDLRLQAFNAGAIASRASNLQVRIFIVHLDQSTSTLSDDELQRLFPDDPDYWRANRQAMACTDDSSCRNYEVCRVPQANGADDPDAGGATYCMINRNEIGQVGPINEYAEIACESGGSYLYVNDNRSIAHNMEWLPYALDGLWSASLTVDAFENETVPMGESYYLETQFSATVGDTRRSSAIARAGRSAAVSAAQDTRAVVNY